MVNFLIFDFTAKVMKKSDLWFKKKVWKKVSVKKQQIFFLREVKTPD